MSEQNISDVHEVTDHAQSADAVSTAGEAALHDLVKIPVEAEDVDAVEVPVQVTETPRLVGSSQAGLQAIKYRVGGPSRW